MMSRVRGRHVPLTAVGLGLGGAMALVLGVMAMAGDDRPIESLPFVALVSLPVVLAAIGLRRPPALVAAGALSLPLSLLSLAGATLPLIVPGVLYLVAYGRARVGRARVHVALILVFAIASAALSFALTMLTAETVCTETVVRANGERSTKDVPEDGAHVLTTGGGGPRVVSTSCSEVPPDWSLGAVLALLIGTAALVGWMSKEKPVL
jgi:hypothetical protein